MMSFIRLVTLIIFVTSFNDQVLGCAIELVNANYNCGKQYKEDLNNIPSGDKVLKCCMSEKLNLCLKRSHQAICADVTPNIINEYIRNANIIFEPGCEDMTNKSPKCLWIIYDSYLYMLLIAIFIFSIMIMVCRCMCRFICPRRRYDPVFNGTAMIHRRY